MDARGVILKLEINASDYPYETLRAQASVSECDDNHGLMRHAWHDQLIKLSEASRRRSRRRNADGETDFPNAPELWARALST